MVEATSERRDETMNKGRRAVPDRRIVEVVESTDTSRHEEGQYSPANPQLLSNPESVGTNEFDFYREMLVELLTKLEIAPDTVLLLRTPADAKHENVLHSMETIKSVVKANTGVDPGMLVVPRDAELVAVGAESLKALRIEIDSALQYIYSKNGGSEGN